jgi:hypothetical protein
VSSAPILVESRCGKETKLRPVTRLYQNHHYLFLPPDPRLRERRCLEKAAQKFDLSQLAPAGNPSPVADHVPDESDSVCSRPKKACSRSSRPTIPQQSGKRPAGCQTPMYGLPRRLTILGQYGRGRDEHVTDHGHLELQAQMILWCDMLGCGIPPVLFKQRASIYVPQSSSH